MPKDSVNPVKLDIGLKAELTAHVPPESAGRAIDALTDIISPISEWAGLKGDQIRLQRLDVLLEIAKKQSERQTILAGQEKVPLKFLAPYLERASTEQIGGYLIKWWADMLSSARHHKKNQQPIFVDFISKLTGEDGAVLDHYWNLVSIVGRPLNDPFTYISKFVRDEVAAVGEEALQKVEIYETEIRRILQALRRQALLEGIIILRAKFPSRKYGDGEQNFHATIQDLDSLQRCVAIGILKEVSVNFDSATPFIGTDDFILETICFSKVGSEFMKACHIEDVH